MGIRNLIAEDIGARIPKDLTEHTALLFSSSRMSGKRALEDAVIDTLIREQDKPLLETAVRLEKAAWYVLSARRADRLLRVCPGTSSGIAQFSEHEAD